MSRADLKRQLATSAALEAELNKERASGLGRTARQLEELLASCSTLRAELEHAKGDHRRVLLEEYDAVRRRAEEVRWYLMVQREAIGARRHDDVDALYPRPPVIRS